MHAPGLASQRSPGVTANLAAAERLEVFPESGRIVPERQDPAVREVIVQPYRLVYRLGDDVVEVATVFRASRLLTLSE
ncbi:MAG TPA: type II toxin-antitoxin system RelE/ParE family toxin [Chloroflexota bacterium]|nr:type II toxin-antitoxin system RelE/ParE family toxin [Chloroflexota bacterium]